MGESTATVDRTNPEIAASVILILERHSTHVCILFKWGCGMRYEFNELTHFSFHTSEMSSESSFAAETIKIVLYNFVSK